MKKATIIEKRDGASPVETRQAGEVPGPLPRRGPPFATGGQTDLTDNDLAMFTDYENGHGHRLTQTGFGCCGRPFGSLRALRIHQGKTCMRKRKCGSSDRKTRSKSSPQDENHSGMICTSPDIPLVQEVVEQEREPQEREPQEEGLRKPKILWPAANEKAKYRGFEEKAIERLNQKESEWLKREERKSTKERLNQLSATVYDTGNEDFGVKEGGKRQTEKVGGKRRCEWEKEHLMQDVILYLLLASWFL